MVSVCVCVVYIKTCVTVNKTMGLKHTVYSGLIKQPLDYNIHNPSLPGPHLPDPPYLDYNTHNPPLLLWTD